MASATGASGRYFFSTFQNTGTGDVTLPLMFLRGSHRAGVLAEHGVRRYFGGAELDLLDELLALGLVGLVGEGLDAAA